MKVYNNFDPTGCLISEKYDGVSAHWNGTSLVSRDGNTFSAPQWFLDSLPLTECSGELWVGRGKFEECVSIVSSRDAGDRWRQVQFLVWSSPTPTTSDVLRGECNGREHLMEVYGFAVENGAEGVVIRDNDGIDWKLKPVSDDDAEVIEHKRGTGRNANRCGSLLVADSEGRMFSVGGLSDALRDSPPAIGSIITFRFQGRTAYGTPRFPAFAGVRAESSFV